MTGRGLTHGFQEEKEGLVGVGGVTASTLAAERDELPPGLGLSFISKRRQMVGLALTPSPQSPKVCFRDGCGERERCRGGRGTSARGDNGGGGAASTSGLLVRADVRASILLIPSHLSALVFFSLSQVWCYQADTFQRGATFEDAASPLYKEKNRRG